VFNRKERVIFQPRPIMNISLISLAILAPQTKNSVDKVRIDSELLALPIKRPINQCIRQEPTFQPIPINLKYPAKKRYQIISDLTEKFLEERFKAQLRRQASTLIDLILSKKKNQKFQKSNQRKE
jgi:hypothetical protein